MGQYSFSLTYGVVCDTIKFMRTHEKTLARMRNNPRDWRIDDLKSVANHLGVDWRNEGSHFLALLDKAKEMKP